MHFQTELVTPQLAAAYLEKNNRNRPMSAGRVRLYVQVMKRGEWMFNGDPIRFSDRGELIDGQHRLKAVCESGCAQQFFVIRDLPFETFKTIDIGASRTGGDILALDGIKNANISSAGARLFLMWKMTGNPVHGNPDKKPTNAQILDFARDNDILERAASYAAGQGFLKKFMSTSLTAFLYLAISTVSEEKAVEFLDSVNSPSVIKSSDPAFMLRERLVSDFGNKARLKRPEKIALAMKAFRLWHKGGEVKALRVITDGDRQEKNIFRVE
jgi:hypothetical protein